MLLKTGIASSQQSRDIAMTFCKNPKIPLGSVPIFYLTRDPAFAEEAFFKEHEQTGGKIPLERLTVAGKFL